MAACGLVHPAAIIGIVGLAQSHAPGSVLIVLGAISGLALPPVSASMRVIWGVAVDQSERTAAYSLVYLTQELAVLGGPLVLSGLIALANPSLALIVVAGLAGAGTLTFATLVATHPEMRSARAAGGSGHVFSDPGMRVLVAVASLTGAIIGALEVAAPTLATAHHAPAASGLLIAALAVGGIGGATIYGARRWVTPAVGRLLWLLAWLAVAVALLIPSSGLVLVGGLLLMAGFSLNPTLTTISLLVDQHVAQDRAAEAFGWLSFGIAGGTGAASAVAGAVTDGGHGQVAFVVGAVAAVGALLLALWAASGSRVGPTQPSGFAG
jgi:hypothetical protein